MINAIMTKDMIALAPEAVIPAWPDGTLVSGGWFCVDHTKGRSERPDGPAPWKPADSFGSGTLSRIRR